VDRTRHVEAPGCQHRLQPALRVESQSGLLKLVTRDAERFHAVHRQRQDRHVESGAACSAARHGKQHAYGWCSMTARAIRSAAATLDVMGRECSGRPGLRQHRRSTYGGDGDADAGSATEPTMPASGASPSSGGLLVRRSPTASTRSRCGGYGREPDVPARSSLGHVLLAPVPRRQGPQVWPGGRAPAGQA
jgi:hypothetical protein